MSDLAPSRSEVVLRALDAVDAKRLVEKHHSRAPLVEVAVRDGGETGDGSYTITGHAATTNSEYVLFENDFMRIRERISADAFDDVLTNDVHLNINHDMRYAMARTGVTGIGSLELSMDAVGLRTFARVSPNITFVRDLAEQMRLGIIDQMSFAFTIEDETRNVVDDGEFYDVLYDITKIGKLYDVCVCAQGANPQTDSSLRSLEAALGRDAEASGQDHRAPLSGVGGRDTAHRDSGTPGSQSGDGLSQRVRVAQAQARARSKRSHLIPKD